MKLNVADYLTAEKGEKARGFAEKKYSAPPLLTPVLWGENLLININVNLS